MYPPATSALPLAPVLGAARGSTRCGETRHLGTPSASAASSPACCTQFRLPTRPLPSASQGSLSLETTALRVHPERLPYAPPRNRRSPSEIPTRHKYETGK